MKTVELNAKLQSLRKEAEERARAWEIREALYLQRHMDSRRLKELKILPRMKRARIEDYTEWLRGYMENGGIPSHVYDYPMPQCSFFVASQDFELFPLYGTSSMEIIIPKGIHFLGGERGHTNLYFMEDFRNVGSWVPLFNDIKF